MTAPLGTVTVLGTGVLGSQIAYQSAYCGYSVTAYDVDDAALGVGRERITGLAERYEREVDGAAGGAADAALARIRYTSDLPDAARDADLVIEAIPEILDLKREVFAKLGRSRRSARSSRRTAPRSCRARWQTPPGGPTGSSRCTSRTRSGPTTSRR